MLVTITDDMARRARAVLAHRVTTHRAGWTCDYCIGVVEGLGEELTRLVALVDERAATGEEPE